MMSMLSEELFCQFKEQSIPYIPMPPLKPATKQNQTHATKFSSNLLSLHFLNVLKKMLKRGMYTEQSHLVHDIYTFAYVYTSTITGKVPNLDSQLKRESCPETHSFY